MPRRCGECRQEGHNRRNCPVIRQREWQLIQEQQARTLYERLQERQRQQQERPRQYQPEHPRRPIAISVMPSGQDDGWYWVRETFAEGFSNSYNTRNPPQPLNQPITTPLRPAPARRVAPARTITTKKSIPKHIAEQVWELNEPDCMICLSKIDKEEFKLSPCGHNYCKTCYEDTRLDKCGECRAELC